MLHPTVEANAAHPRVDHVVGQDVRYMAKAATIEQKPVDPLHVSHSGVFWPGGEPLVGSNLGLPDK